ncbi:MAG: hypothetical protein HQL31_01705 [Planctomycetes bacterium]|nr:hypothetical protein [Planctomycetota bacterium]
MIPIIRSAVLVVLLVTLTPLFGTGPTPLEIASKLESAGFFSLSIRYYNKALEAGLVQEKDLDDVNLTLYRLYNALVPLVELDKQDSLREKAKLHYGKIKNKERDEIRLEKVQSDLKYLRDLFSEVEKARYAGETIEEKRQSEIAAQATTSFKNFVTVVFEVRKTVSKWIESYDSLSEDDQKKMENDFDRYRKLEISVNLLFGEGVVTYAKLVDRGNALANTWLTTLVASYEDFVSEYSGYAVAVLGSIYLGEANIMLGSYVPQYGGAEAVDGAKVGEQCFSDALASLDFFAKGAHRVWAEDTTIMAYSNWVRALEFSGKEDLAISVVDRLIAWKDPGSIDSDKQKRIFFQVMSLIMKKCMILEAKVKEYSQVPAGNNVSTQENKSDEDGSEQAEEKGVDTKKSAARKVYLEELHRTVNLGLTAAKRQNSPIVNNFNVLLKRLPPVPGLKLPPAVLVMRGDEILSKAQVLYEKAKELADQEYEDELKRISEEIKDPAAQAKEKGLAESQRREAYITGEHVPLFFEAAEFYRQAVVDSEKAKISVREDILPNTLYKLAVCYRNTENLHLALAADLKAIEMFPSTVYGQDSHPGIYTRILKCAKHAKFCAGESYYRMGQGTFDMELYMLTNSIMVEFFPEEGGSPVFINAILLKNKKSYAAAKKEFAKITEDDDNYMLAQFHAADCGYQLLLDRELKAKEEGKEIKKSSSDFIGPRKELLPTFEQVIEVCSKKPKQKEGMKEKDYAMLLRRTDDARARSMRRVARLYRDIGELGLERKAHENMVRVFDKMPELKLDALKSLVYNSYKQRDLNLLDQDVKALEAFVNEDVWPESERDADIGSYYKMMSNVVVSEKIPPLKKAMDELLESGDKAGAAEKDMAMSNAFVEVADLLALSLEKSKSKDVDLLKKIIGYYFNYHDDATKALPYLKKYFEWYPQKPKLEGWYLEELGKEKASWDVRIGSFADKINHPKMTELYNDFLDALFDKSDYSKMEIVELRKMIKSSGDRPRNYSRATDLLKEMTDSRNIDISFRKNVYPSLIRMQPLLDEISNYYGLRYWLAQCYTRNDDFADASEVFLELVHYYVEYYDIRIEMGKAEYLKNSAEGYANAEKIFRNLLAVVPPPGDTYNPRDYYNLVVWYTKSRISALGSNNTCDNFMSFFKSFHSALLQDTRYLLKDPTRFTELKLEGKLDHYKLIDFVRSYVEKELLPRQKECSGKDMSWEQLLAL